MFVLSCLRAGRVPTCLAERDYKEKEMKIRTISIFLIFTLAALLPTAAQQTPAPAAPKANTNSACACCSHERDGVDDTATVADRDPAVMVCCNGKSSCELACGKSKAGNSKSGGEKMTMGSGKSLDAKMCAGKDGKSCCSAPKGTQLCCRKDAAACNSKDAKNCCGSMDCGKHPA